MKLQTTALPAALILFMFGYGLYSTAHYFLVANKPWVSEINPESIVRGQTTHAIETGIEKDVGIRDWSIYTWNALSYGVFGQARSGALVGSDHWLFSEEEFLWTRQSPSNVAAALERIKGVVEQLHGKGAKVALVLVPAKADIYRQYLGGYQLPDQLGDLYPNLMAQVQGTGADFIPDLGKQFADHRFNDLFLRSDTHWTVAGAALAAQLVCTQIESSLVMPPMDFTVNAQQSVEHRGDLTNFIALGPYERWLPLPKDVITPLVATADIQSLGEDSLFGDSPSNTDPAIALVGTSYSANPLWSFDSSLRSACKQDVLNFAADGSGPFEPMKQYLAELDSGAAKVPEVVVWEVPVRYLDDYSAEALGVSAQPQ